MRINIFLYTRILLLFISIAYSDSIDAYDFEVDGIYYNILEDKANEVEVTYKDYQKGTDYSGSLSIPSKVEYQGNTYSVTSIGDYAFYSCSGLTGSLTIPNSVTSIGWSAFRGCSGFTGSLTIPNSVTSIGPAAFADCSGFTGSLTISNSVTSIDVATFSGCSGFTGSLTIPNSVTYIGDSAFSGCSGFTGSLTIPNSITSIQYRVFEGCSGFTGSLTIPNSVAFIKDSAFANCSGFTGSLTIPNSVKEIKSYAFLGCSGLTGSLTIPNSVTLIGWYAFSGCSGFTGSLTIPNSVTSIGMYAFYNCRGLTGSLTIPNSVTSIGMNAFCNCSGFTGTLTIPNSVTSIEKYAFSGCSGFTGSLTIPNSVAFIKDAAFSGCSGITDTLSIPSTIISIGEYAFSKFKNIKDVKSFLQQPFEISDNVFKEISSNAVLEIPSGTKDYYTKYSGWTKHFKDIVEFDITLPIFYTLCISASSNGGVSYNGENYFIGITKTYTVTEGANATITFMPNNGYRIKSVKVGGTDVTSSVLNNKYTVSNIKANTTVSVEFEAIPPTTYTLKLIASGKGHISYNGTSVENTSKSITIEEGISATITFHPDEGYQIKSATMNGRAIQDLSDMSFTIDVMDEDVTIAVEFEAIPPTTYTLSISASGNGSATYNGVSIREATKSFTVIEGTGVTITFHPDEGYQIKSVTMNGRAIQDMSDMSFTIDLMDEDVTIAVEFMIIPPEMVSHDGLDYQVMSYDDRTVMLNKADYGLVLEVPAQFTAEGETWKVVGIERDALDYSPELAAIIWNPEVKFEESVSNPNLLLYVSDSRYAPSAIGNVIVGDRASKITLTDAQSGNNFYCPRAFTATNISYEHYYGMKTGLEESRGWETLSLPFDVQEVTHQTMGQIVPYSKWTKGNGKPFWLYELSANGFVEATGIQANTPYIISMPNHEQYQPDYRLQGYVTFSAENVKVETSDKLYSTVFRDRTFLPCFQELAANAGGYALNVQNDYGSYLGVEAEGSKFVKNLRTIHPFEAYMISESRTRSIDIFDGMTTGIRGVEMMTDESKMVRVYSLQGIMVNIGATIDEAVDALTPGVYIVDGKKVIIK